jgi:glycosyltransferase involved in cell wall biosynthesis
MTTPTVSVAIPLYNKASFIVDTVRSALAQTFNDFEIVIVDDGSTDGGAEKLLPLSESRLIIIRQQNAGVAAARTRAMREGRGRYVAFLDADDLWHPDHLLRLMELTRRYPDAALFGNDYAESSGRGAAPDGGHAAPYYRLVDDYFAECAAGRAPFYTSSCMVLRERALALGGFPTGNYYGGEDLALWMRLAAEMPVAVSTFVGCHYRRGIASLTRDASFRAATDVSMSTLKELLVRRSDWPAARKVAAREFYNRLALAHALDCVRADDCESARMYVDLAADTKTHRRRYWLVRLLVLFPLTVREAFFHLADLRRR